MMRARTGDTMAKKQKVAGPWMGNDGGDVEPPCTREDISGPEGVIAVTLAIVYPTCVYVRREFRDDWHKVKDKAAADRWLKRAGWILT